jgi:hypothetical protein
MVVEVLLQLSKGGLIGRMTYAFYIIWFMTVWSYMVDSQYFVFLFYVKLRFYSRVFIWFYIL